VLIALINLAIRAIFADFLICKYYAQGHLMQKNRRNIAIRADEKMTATRSSEKQSQLQQSNAKMEYKRKGEKK
jgi:hypothetical protein